MTKEEFSEIIADKLGCGREEAKKHLEAMMAATIELTTAGETIYLRGFGSFGTKRRKAKIARNISKNESIKISACNIPFFKPALVYKEAIKKSKKVR